MNLTYDESSLILWIFFDLKSLTISKLIKFLIHLDTIKFELFIIHFNCLNAG